MPSDDESGIDMESALPKKIAKKTPKSPTGKTMNNQEPKKLTTRMMIEQALVDLHTRKGVSLQAIKKYMVEKYNADTEKLNYYIKKSIKIGVESGTIIQTKGMGASGSFKLAPVKKKQKVTNENKAKTTEKSEMADEVDKVKEIEKVRTKKSKLIGEKQEIIEKKPVKGTEDSNSKKMDKEKSTKKVVEKKPKIPKVKESKTAKDPKISEMAKSSKTGSSKTAVKNMTPAQKRATMMKRKSIGSLLKPPKMKPKARE